MVLFSTIANTNTVVLAGTGVVAVVCYVLGLLPKLSEYMPTFLMDGNSLIYGVKDVGDYKTSLIIAVVTGVLCFGASVPVLNRKKI